MDSPISPWIMCVGMFEALGIHWGLSQMRFSWVSLTATCRFCFNFRNIGMRGAGCGVREGVAADAATFFIWGFCPGGVKNPVFLNG